MTGFHVEVASLEMKTPSAHGMSVGCSPLRIPSVVKVRCSKAECQHSGLHVSGGSDISLKERHSLPAETSKSDRRDIALLDGSASESFDDGRELGVRQAAKSAEKAIAHWQTRVVHKGKPRTFAHIGK